MSKNVIPTNAEGNLHGYCEKYHYNGQLHYKGYWIDGRVCGYCECYNKDGSAVEGHTGYFFNGIRVSSDNEDGSCYIWDRVVV